MKFCEIKFVKHEAMIGSIFYEETHELNREKMLVREVLSDRCRITQEKFQYQGVEICMTFQACTLNSSRNSSH